MSNKKVSLTLTSTIVSPFQNCKLLVVTLGAEEFAVLSKIVSKNYCGHPQTIAHLQAANISLPAPAPKGEFWDMKGVAIAARPKGGVRGAAEVAIDALDQLEFAAFIALAPHSEEEASDLNSILEKLIRNIENGEPISGTGAVWFEELTSQCAIK